MYNKSVKEIYIHYGFFICTLLLLIAPIHCRYKKPTWERQGGCTKAPVELSSTTESEDEPDATDGAEKEVLIDDIFVMDYGRYSTVNFHYERHQYIVPGIMQTRESCYDSYTKCITSRNHPMPVCVYYGYRYLGSYYDYTYQYSYCDAYFENCRLAYRYWRILQYGNCNNLGSPTSFFWTPYTADW